ncbi:MAG: CesT family type III secretion system chaperone [Ramlibacter sp.]
MNAQTYSRVITEWCEATGMQPWAADADMHIDIESTTVGLLYDETVSPNALHIYIDLGHMELPDLHRRLLELNMSLDSPHSGCFALHPEAGSLVFRAAIELSDDTDGATLPQHIADMIAAARAPLH